MSGHPFSSSYPESYEIRRLEGIRDRAYLLWEAAGRPQGRDMEFWLQAERERSPHDSYTNYFRDNDPRAA